jgi:hypothetical protein
MDSVVKQLCLLEKGSSVVKRLFFYINKILLKTIVTSSTI